MASTQEQLSDVLAQKKEELMALQRRRKEREERRAKRPNSPAKQFDVAAIIESIADQVTPADMAISAAVPEISLFGGAGGQQTTAAGARLQAEVETLTEELKVVKKQVYALQDTVAYEKTTQTVQTDPWETSGMKGDVEEEEVEQVEQAAEQTEQKEEQAVVEVAEDPAKAYTPAEVKQICNSGDFCDFLERASKLTERVLTHATEAGYDDLVGWDPHADYAGHHETDDHKDAAGEAVALALELTDSKLCGGRAITCMDWSPKFPELIAVGYNANEHEVNQPDGLVLVWNTKVPLRPEFVFTCQTSVTAVCFSPFQPNILVGGTYSGQLVLWDKRARKTPVQRSALSSSSHTHPVYSMEVIGTQNAHNLVSISTDGVCCSWNLDIMQEPSEMRILIAPPSKQVAVTALAFPIGDSNNFVVGSEEGVVFQASRNNGLGEEFQGHAGPVTAVSFHKAAGNAEFSHYFLSSSTDWTIKLWSYRNNKEAIASFENAGDYIYDVQWSPRNPALFASVDGLGQLDFWNINQDAEVPVASITIGEGKHALNRLKWSNDGRSLAVADAAGVLHIYSVGDRLCHPRPDEYGRLRTTLTELVSIQEEKSKRL